MFSQKWAKQQDRTHQRKPQEGEDKFLFFNIIFKLTKMELVNKKPVKRNIASLNDLD